jgi:UDP-perosamine 4-acetyltransferase
MSEAAFIVLGGGGHARVVIHCLQTLGHRVDGYTALHDLGVQRGIPYLGTDRELPLQSPGVTSVAMALGIGKVTVQTPRLALMEAFLSDGFHFPPIVATRAVVHDDVQLGVGTAVFDGAVMVTGTRVGRACIINTNATVDHDCELGDDVHIAPGAILSGGVRVGSRCLIGTGARVIQGVSIAADCLVAAGATVVRDLDEPGTYKGTPARRIV